MKKILVTGCCGYVGTELVNFLLENNYEIIGLDTGWFGNNLPKDKRLQFREFDIRNIDKFDNQNKIDAVIHLANIANDPSVELDPTLSWETNVLASMKICEFAKKNNIKRVIYASSGSVYGIKEDKNVTEDLPLEPISLYNKTKMIAERIFFSYRDDFLINIIRPATVCGYSRKMRLDLSVNALTFSALSKNKINVYGGNQIRPNIHINDMIRVYNFFIENDIESGFYNAGFENISILDIAKMVSKKLNCKIEIDSSSNDPRSYRQNSDKLIKLGFKNSYSVKDAIEDLILKFSTGELTYNKDYYAIGKLKEILKLK